MQNIITAANGLSTTINNFCTEAFDVHTTTMAWLTNLERVPDDLLTRVHQLRVLLQSVFEADRMVSHEYMQIADKVAFKPTGLKETAEQLDYGPIADSARRIAVSTISRRGFPRYLDEVSRLVSMLDVKVHGAETSLQVWNRNVGNRPTMVAAQQALDEMKQQTEALQGFALSGMLIIIAAANAQTTAA